MGKLGLWREEAPVEVESGDGGWLRHRAVELGRSGSGARVDGGEGLTGDGIRWIWPALRRKELGGLAAA